MALGDYPEEYNPKIHGPYDPSRYYGKPDTPFLEVKITELPGWFARRNKSPVAIIRGVSRLWWKWQHKYVQPKRSGITPFFQLVVCSCTFFFLLNTNKIWAESVWKYHWGLKTARFLSLSTMHFLNNTSKGLISITFFICILSWYEVLNKFVYALVFHCCISLGLIAAYGTNKFR